MTSLTHETDRTKGFMNRNNPKKIHIEKTYTSAITHHKKRVSEYDVKNQIRDHADTSEYILEVPRQMITGDQKSQNPIDISKVIQHYKHRIDKESFNKERDYIEPPQSRNQDIIGKKEGYNNYNDVKNISENPINIDIEAFKSTDNYISKNFNTDRKKFIKKHINQKEKELQKEGYRSKKKYFNKQFNLEDNDSVNQKTLIENILIQDKIQTRETYPVRNSDYNNLDTKEYTKEFYIKPEVKTTKIDSVVSFQNSNTETYSKINDNLIEPELYVSKNKNKIEDRKSTIDLISPTKLNVNSVKSSSLKHINNLNENYYSKKLTKDVLHAEYYTNNNTKIIPNSSKENYKSHLKYKPSLENKRYFQNKMGISRNKF
jgi:hypothetical protein